MKFNHYSMPTIDEINVLGYQPQYVDPKISDAIYSALIMIGSPFAPYGMWYKTKYKNVLELSRRAVTVYAYGVHNLNWFGNEEKEVAYHCIRQITNIVLHKYNAFSGKKTTRYVLYNRKFIDSFISVIVDSVDKEAREQIARVEGTVVPYWFEKKRKVKPKMRVPVCRGGSYRIERYADMYD